MKREKFERIFHEKKKFKKILIIRRDSKIFSWKEKVQKDSHKKKRFLQVITNKNSAHK